jgi:hypothetical protein
MNPKIRQLIPHISAIVLFFLINAVYFYPQLQGEVVQQPDIVSWRGMAGEPLEFQEKTGERYYWNNGMFTGMPWQMLHYSSGNNKVREVQNVVRLGFDRPIGYYFQAMLFAYILFAVLGVNPWLAILGAIAFAFSTNHFVVFEAGHNAKVATLANFPLILAGVLLAYRQKYIWGAVLFAVGTSLAFYNTHPQMLYYLFMGLGIYFLTKLVFTAREGDWMPFLKGTGALALALALSLGSAFSQLYSSQKFSEDTMRGEPILKLEKGTQAKSSSEVKGLEWGYAMQWSQGWLDLFSTFIPRVAGGSSGESVGSNTRSYDLFRRNGMQPEEGGTFRAPMYWGPLPSTSGPPYLGAIVVFLFVMSLFLLKGPIKWGFGLAVLFTSLLSLGQNFELLNRLVFDYFPFYNKFRSPNSIFVATALFFVIPAILGLSKIKDNPKESLRALYWSVGITGGLCLFFALIGPGFFDFSSPGDARYQETIRSVFVEDRQALMRSDSLRSLLLILLSGGLLWAYLKNRLQQTMVFGVIGLLVLFDLWTVGRRYLNNSNFVTERQYEQNFAPRPVDEQIKQMEPKGRGYYRVFDLSINTFNSSSTSYHHNTIGGYNAAKLQRYQDMIDYHISQGNQKVLNMLNTKYVISREGQVTVNPGALGNAWFVDSLITVSTPREEIEALGAFNPAKDAVVLAEEFGDYLSGFSPSSPGGTIELVEYEPTRLVYEAEVPAEDLAVFSEAWYGPEKGWSVSIDGEPAQHIRANYSLRALKVPAGKHTIEFTFTPQSKGGFLSLLSSLIILLGLVGYGGFQLYSWSQKPAPIPEPVKKEEKQVSRKTKATRTKKKRK